MTTLMRVILVVLVVLCAACGEGVMAQENRKLWNEKSDRELFVRELKVRNIPFRVDSEGGIWYPASEVSTVDAISKDILTKTTGPGIYFEDPVDDADFRKRLEIAGIPFQVRRRFEKDWVTWDKQHDERVTAIRDAVDNESLSRSQERRKAR
jgi:hypothetical protein